MLHLTIQDISDLFSKFEGDNNVLWIRDITYKKQLYISENYQKLFGQTCESLYEYPESWSERVVNLELSSSDIKLVRKESGICVPYSVISDSGEAYSVQDKSFIVYDKSGVEQVAVIGIANCTRVNDFSNNQVNKQQDSVNQTSSAIKKALEQVSIQFYEAIPKIVLSPREKECLKHIINGKTAKLCANAMDLSYRTVESYISHIKDKLGVNTRADLIALAMKLKLVD